MTVLRGLAAMGPLGGLRQPAPTNCRVVSTSGELNRTLACCCVVLWWVAAGGLQRAATCISCSNMSAQWAVVGSSGQWWAVVGSAGQCWADLQVPVGVSTIHPAVQRINNHHSAAHSCQTLTRYIHCCQSTQAAPASAGQQWAAVASKSAVASSAQWAAAHWLVSLPAAGRSCRVHHPNCRTCTAKAVRA